MKDIVARNKMFDFMRDIYLELSGIDSSEVEKERKKKLERKKKDKFIFSQGMKILIFVLGILYLVISGFNVATSKQMGNLNTYVVIRFIFLISCDVASLTFLVVGERVVGKRKAEITVLILIIVFVLTQYFTALFI